MIDCLAAPSLQDGSGSAVCAVARPEETSGFMSSLDTFVFEIDRPAVSAQPESEPGAGVAEDAAGEGEQIQGPDTATGDEPAEPETVQDPGMTAAERAAR